MGGLLSQLVGIKAQREQQAFNTQVDMYKAVYEKALNDPSSVEPGTLEAAANAIGTLADSQLGGGKGKGSKGKGGGVGDLFKSMLTMGAYNIYKQQGEQTERTRTAEEQARAGMAGKKITLTPEEKARVEGEGTKVQDQIALEYAEKLQKQKDRLALADNQQKYEQQYDRLIKSGMDPKRAAEEANAYASGRQAPTERSAASIGTPKTVFGIVKGQEDEGLQMLFINPRDPASGFMDASGQNYKKDEISGITTSPPAPDRMYGRTLEISKFVQSFGWEPGTPEYKHWFGIVAGADLQASIGRQQQAGAIAGFESGIPLGQGFPAIPRNPNAKKEGEGTTAPSTSTPTIVAPTAAPWKPPLSSRAAPAAPASVANAPADDRFQSMYLASLMSDAPVAGGAARVGVIKGRESFKKILGLSAADFSMIEAANKDQRKGLADTIQRAVATQRVNDILSEFGDEAVKRAKNILNTNSPLLNKPIRSIELSAVGDPDIRRFLISLNAFQRQYGILTSGSPQSRAQIPVSVGEKVDKIIDPNATLSEVISTVDQVKIEGKQEAQGFKNAAKETIDSITGSLKPKGASGGGAQGTPTRTGTGPNGEKWGLIDNKWVQLK